ncbi:MAG: AI-2E family transporter [Phycisphaeraceae bacterium]|nr:AI-2E family transporter [Phycisphaeraceae bacterium]
MARAQHPANRLPLVISGFLIAAVLYFAREVLVPIALAVFVAFVLAPIVRQLERLRVPRVLAVALTVGTATVGIGVLGWLVEQQAVEVATNLHDYRANIVNKLAILRPSKHSALGKAGTAIQELGKEIAKPVTESPTATGLPAESSLEPIGVRVVEDPTPPITYARDILGPVLSRLATVVMVVVFAIFMLLRREDLRNRLIRLIGEREMHITTPAFDDAAQRLSRYLLAQSILNAGVGGVVGVGLFLLGVPNAPLWGFLIAILRFVPYVGTWIGAAFPILISIAIFDGWRQPLLVAGLVIGVEIVGGSFVEPMLVGSGTGLSPLAVLTSAIFWAWLWGPFGLILSTPITVCLSVLGKHVPRLSFLNVLLGDEPVLTPETRFYQRLLAGDQEESTRIVEEFAKGKSSVEVYGLLLIPALRLAEFDRHRGELDETQEQAVRETLTAIIDDIGSQNPDRDASEAFERVPVVCVPARDAADELSARMLEKLLIEQGIRAETHSSRHSPRELLEQLAKLPPSVLCICALPPNALLHTRVLWQQLRLRCPEHRIVIGLWDDKIDMASVRERLGRIPSESIATTMKQATEIILGVLKVDAVITGAADPEEEESRTRPRAVAPN